MRPKAKEQFLLCYFQSFLLTTEAKRPVVCNQTAARAALQFSSFVLSPKSATRKETLNPNPQALDPKSPPEQRSKRKSAGICVGRHDTYWGVCTPMFLGHRRMQASRSRIWDKRFSQSKTHLKNNLADACRAVFWKERGIFLLHILTNVTSRDEAVVFLLTRRTQTINRIM